MNAANEVKHFSLTEDDKFNSFTLKVDGVEDLCDEYDLNVCRILNDFVASQQRTAVRYIFKDASATSGLANEVPERALILLYAMVKATGVRLGALFQAVGTLLIGALMSFFYSWKMTLVCCVCVPIIFCSLIIESIITKSRTPQIRHGVEQAAKVAIEAITHIKTVATFGLEEMFLEKYDEKLAETEQPQMSILFWRAMVFALGYSSINSTYTFAILYSVFLITKENVPYRDTIIVAESILFGSWLVCQLLTLAPNVHAGRQAAGRLFNILDRRPKVHDPADDGRRMNLSGDLKFTNVTFCYPKRPSMMVLKQLDMIIPKGKCIGIVGLSGSGKSTCLQMLERFYDPVDGFITMNGKCLSEIPLRKLRARLGVVSQEPVLFERSVFENIAYGNNFRDVHMNEIMEAAKRANVHDFISALPRGYLTKLGSRGSQLSGGQKQRIAIARTLVRNPPVLILDEATSALDNHNEKIVDLALKAAMKGRTCIIIAHKLKTVEECDLIYVMSNGSVVEFGNHQELLQLNNYYARMLRQQELLV